MLRPQSQTTLHVEIETTKALVDSTRIDQFQDMNDRKPMDEEIRAAEYKRGTAKAVARRVR